jgi:putative methyltransferase (TIGR04325 family)
MNIRSAQWCFGRLKTLGTRMDSEATHYQIGDEVPPPYFFGVEPAGILKEHYDDPFNTPGWADHCYHAARRLGIRGGEWLAAQSAPRWKQALRATLDMVRSPSRASQILTGGGACPRHLLPVAGLINDTYERDGKVAVLDVGGGFGDNFFLLLRVLRPEVIATLDYRVLDNERSCQLGRQLFARYRVGPTFSSDHRRMPQGNDVVVVIGTLQYLSQWPTALRGIAGVAKRYLYLARTPITEGTSFTTTQLVCPAYGSQAHRNLGATRINVIGASELRAAVPGDWRLMYELRETDYSPNFARLPAANREASYVNVAWQRMGVR